MSFGAHSFRGNNNPIVAINPDGAPSVITFTAKLWQVVNQPNWFRLVLLASWPNAEGRMIPRQIQLNLTYVGHAAQKDGFRGRQRWNWPFQDDFYPQGGAEIAYIDAELVPAICGTSGGLNNVLPLETQGQEISYAIDVNALFHCLSDNGGWSDSIPTTSNIAVYGVHWAVENVAYHEPGDPNILPGAIWVSVHNINQY
jgi:hypothetical protein